jgi:hypothetical protein
MKNVLDKPEYLFIKDIKNVFNTKICKFKIKLCKTCNG